MKQLEEIGFKPVGTWTMSSSGLELSLYSLADSSPALYAFVIDGDVKYVGKTKLSLIHRLKFYRNPGKSQRTNIRVKAEIIEALDTVDEVGILGFHDPRPQYIGPFRLNLAAGLEDDIISQLRPEWNGGRKDPAISRPETTSITRGAPSGSSTGKAKKVRSDSPVPSFIVTIGKTYFRQGFFNVRVDYEHYFAGHGAEIKMETPDHMTVIHGKVNRTVNANHTPRIMGGAKFRDWLQSNLQLGGSLHVTIREPNYIEVRSG